MNIYIYGDVSFRNEIHKILDHGNIRFKIDEGEVIDVETLYSLEELIEEDPTQIFLIDQKKIIEDDLFTNTFKFLIPKDGISKKFLDDNGIGDISLRTYKDLLVYIEKRLEAIENNKPKAGEITTIDEILEDDIVDVLNQSFQTEVRS
ncbi:MAG: hypothetical protein U9N59_04930 [Campylobacterota bacterium]|nr:hypothetical protein [Campylobacterota bacterium]